MNIDKIRLLLDRFYNGTASVAETDELAQYFAEAHDIPDDLLPDAAIFKALASRTAPSVPDDLKEKIEHATFGARSRRRFLSWKTVLSVAASVAVILSLGISLLHNDRPAQSSRIAVNRVAAPFPVKVKEKPVESIPVKEEEVKELPEVKPEKIIRPQTEKIAVESRPRYANYREITDSAEVVEITSRILALLDNSFSKTENGVRQTEMAFAILSDPLSTTDFSSDNDK